MNHRGVKIEQGVWIVKMSPQEIPPPDWRKRETVVYCTHVEFLEI